MYTNEMLKIKQDILNIHSASTHEIHSLIGATKDSLRFSDVIYVMTKLTNGSIKPSFLFYIVPQFFSVVSSLHIYIMSSSYFLGYCF